MKKLYLIFAALIFSLAAAAQFTVSGRIVDSATREPLHGASVYGQNTTIGTTTNKEGGFSLSLKSGGYELIVSYTGYQTRYIRISHTDAQLGDIEMIPEEKSLGEVVITSSNEVPDGWEKYGSFFTGHFIGTTPFAEAVTLLNPEALKFYFLRRSNKLRVLATEPLLIENRALGYQLRYELDSFIYHYNTDINTYRGFCLFTPLEGDERMQQVWAANRREAYYGSKLHFMRSYYDSTVVQDGWQIDILNPQDSTRFFRIANVYDSRYYGEADSTGNIELWFPAKVSIIYPRKKPSPEYLKQYGLPPDVPIQISYIDMMDAIIIQENGYYFDQKNWINQGYWSWKNLADQLPYDYVP
ncbi:MAG TPA: carboxypeptidase-like regulatory domain-containing protein [Chitinophagaceae bacterium]|nr:carboxypeptidase-like regulatory domain-containing protein [Chitinophagaceae bacterium]